MSNENRPRLRQAAGIGAVLQSVIQQRGVAERLRQYRAWQVWNEVVGPQIAARAQPCRIRDGILEVRVDQAVWMQQLQLLKPKLLARLNDRLGVPLFRDLYLRRGRLEPLPGPAAAPRPQLPPLTAAERSRIEEVLADLRDPELRQRLARLLERQARLAAWRRASRD